jgi:hypothetical protein
LTKDEIGNGTWILAIDPSINSLGWALASPIFSKEFNWDSYHWKCGSFVPRGTTLEAKLCSLNILLDKFPIINELVIEWPMFFNTEKGRIAARAGFTTQLGAVCGYIVGYFSCGHRLSADGIYLYTPQAWKGNMPKRATAMKFIRTFPKRKPYLRIMDHDEIDAIMLLYYHLEKTRQLSTVSAQQVRPL